MTSCQGSKFQISKVFQGLGFRMRDASPTFPFPEHTLYLALAMHSKVVSLDPATTLLLPGATTMTGAMTSWVSVAPAAEKTKRPWNSQRMEGGVTGKRQKKDHAKPHHEEAQNLMSPRESLEFDIFTSPLASVTL